MPRIIRLCLQATSARLYNNRLYRIDLTQNRQLIDVNLQSNRIRDLDLRHNSLLNVAKLSNNGLGLGVKGIHFGSDLQLSELVLGSNKLTNVDLSSLTSLAAVDLSHNNLEYVDFTQNPNLVEVYLNRNPLNVATKVYLDALQGVEVHYDGGIN